jgi:hypothetical protein
MKKFFFFLYLFRLYFRSEPSDCGGLEDCGVTSRDVGDADLRLEGHHVRTTQNVQSLKWVK